MRCIAVVFAVFLALSTGSNAATESSIGSVNVPALGQALPLDPRVKPDGWGTAAHVAMRWDVTHQRPGTEASEAYIATAGNDIYIRFDVKQREPLLAQQHANNIGDGTDDEVWIDLWPDGNAGFFYQFAATSNGTHYQYSSENTAYAPTWESHGASYDGGFTVTMKIPLRVIRGAHSDGTWRAQFVRVVRSTGERQIWSYSPVQTNGDDVNYAGIARGLHSRATTRPQPRFGIYGLTAYGSRGQNLTTSRIGADFSIPITPTASFYSTVHPDFSNVEVDQSTISPTAFARFYSEVRPFFTQGANFYDQFSCDACPGISQLYTPAIPTPRDGYAIEGRQGRATFAAFDAVGINRTDGAETFGLKSKDNRYFLNVQRVASDSPYWHDVVSTTGLSYNDSKHVSAYFNYGSDAGRNVLAGNQAQRYDGGAFVYTNTFGVAFSMRKVGFFYNPVDGFVQHPDIAGHAFYTAKLWQFAPTSKLNAVGASFYEDRYHNASGALDQTDTNVLVDILTQNRIDIQASLGSSYLLANNCVDTSGNLIYVTPLNYAKYAACQVFTPVSQNGIGVTWHSGTANSPGNFPNHGSSSTPTTISYNTGAFGPGRVDSWFRSSTIRAGMRGTVSVELDDTRQYLFNGRTNVQWLERAGYTYEPNPDESIALGVRRIIGTAPYIVTNSPASCVTYLASPLPATPCTGAWNLSFAYHKRTPHDEYYFAYGDASQLSTVPQWIFKWIRYVGAEKGT
ncbi:MAG: hypothetical protein JO165_10375 [Candidatus Eremiobacteraeota bacterium]|nr:hypothetical protein [Candidatus Eremiobacteraeota bacterium]